jgi:hypothetical protein
MVAAAAMIIQLKFSSVCIYKRAGLATQVLVIKPAPRNTTQNITYTQKQNTKRTNQKQNGRKKAI